MKIGILTQPLHTNYGGLLQAFALQKYLRDMGHDVLTVDYENKPKMWLFPYRLARRCVAKFMLRRKISLFPKPLPQGAGKFTQRFIEENIRTTKKIFAPARERDFAEYGFEAFVVGSDQTWRPAYSPHMPTFFLDFLGNDTGTRRVAYASSFGKDEWEFTPEMTKTCAPLAKKFHEISVREDSGVSLCEKYLGVSAEHVIDPTMLLSKEDYCEIVARDEDRGLLEKRTSAKRLFAYVLDEAPEKRALIANVAGTLGFTPEEIMPSREDLTAGTVAYPPLSAWLRGFRDSEFVVTDSFHGCVFSIIFNKPFLAIGNASRGMSRFRSLLKMFGLENRLLLLGEDSANLRERVSSLISEKIDWGGVNTLRSREQERSRVFLEKSLKNNS
ncbi:MAG: polysaccharide pyruvyl transferase family protein [Opitutales bacterium]|nr:polysaccharide pyruvyl transferase family protein [Opitutales bacterium]